MIALPRYFGLPAAFVRHAIAFALAAGSITVQGIVLAVPIETQFGSWLAIALGVGILSALVGRGIVGIVFLVAGFVIGLLALFVVRYGAIDAVAEAVQADGMQYLTVVEGSALAYLITAIVVMRIRR